VSMRYVMKTDRLFSCPLNRRSATMSYYCALLGVETPG
jgi:hypothetical protein